MNLDHVFIDVAVTHPDPAKGHVVGIAVARTDRRGKVLGAHFDRVLPPVEKRESKEFESSDYDDARDYREVIETLREKLIAPFDPSYIIVAEFSDMKRAHLRKASERAKLDGEVFPGRGWLDILQLCWPLAYHDMIPTRELASLCHHFGVENAEPNTSRGNCAAMTAVYWRMMSRYSTALMGEEMVRGYIGEPINQLKRIIGL